MKSKTLLKNAGWLAGCLLTSFTGFSQTFNGPLPIPNLVKADTFNITIDEDLHNFDPSGNIDTANMDTAIKTYSYNITGTNTMSYLGPTLVWEQGHDLQFNIQNNLDGSSTTVHWHGMNLPSEMDGGPHQAIGNGELDDVHFSVIDSVQTLWYHPHLMDSTTVQVIWGLAGMIIIEDSVNDPLRAQLPHDYGVNDFPIVLQEKGFNFSSGSVTSMIIGEKPGNGIYTLVNGVVSPVQEVPNEMVRLRFLNGSPRKSFQVGVSNQLANPSSFSTMHQIGTDGGYTAQPNAADSILISPGERMEMVVDFSQYNDGDTVYLSNLARSIPKDIVTGDNKNTGMAGTPGNAFMAFIINSSIQPSAPITSLPSALVPYTVDTSDIFQERDKVLMRVKDGAGHNVWLINNTPMDMMALNDTLLVNTMEKWNIHNTTGISHPFHIHKVQFQIVEYTGNIGVDSTSTPQTYTYPNLPNYMMGFKDDILVRAGASVSFVARFDSFPDTSIDPRNGFMYHCHILTHEDTAMMHQFTVVDSATYYGSVSTPEVEVKLGELKIFPNPAKEILFINGDIETSGTLRIYDLLGRVLWQEEVPALHGQITINTGTLPRGLVFVEWQNENQRVVEKILLE